MNQFNWHAYSVIQGPTCVPLMSSLKNFIMPNFLCEIANEMVTSCTESEDDFNYSEVTFQYYPGLDSRPTEILIAAND